MGILKKMQKDIKKIKEEIQELKEEKEKFGLGQALKNVWEFPLFKTEMYLSILLSILAIIISLISITR